MNILIFIVILFLIIYKYTNNYNTSLFLSFITLYFYTFNKYLKLNFIKYEYKPILIVFFIILIIIIYKHKYLNISNFINFILLFYFFGSISEYLIHKYIMHADKDKMYYKIINKIPLLNYIFFPNKSHINHHLNIKSDMKLKNEKKYGMYMGWHVFALGIIVAILVIILSLKISNYKMSFLKILIISIIISFIWNLIWNKTHPEMHNYKSDFSLKNGPYDFNLFKFTFLTKILYKNHKIHHLQKGIRKGNYNVILLGADEWFGQNNLIIKN